MENDKDRKWAWNTLEVMPPAGRTVIALLPDGERPARVEQGVGLVPFADRTGDRGGPPIGWRYFGFDRKRLS